MVRFLGAHNGIAEAEDAIGLEPRNLFHVGCFLRGQGPNISSRLTRSGGLKPLDSGDAIQLKKLVTYLWMLMMLVFAAAIVVNFSGYGRVSWK